MTGSGKNEAPQERIPALHENIETGLRSTLYKVSTSSFKLNLPLFELKQDVHSPKCNNLFFSGSPPSQLSKEDTWRKKKSKRLGWPFMASSTYSVASHLTSSASQFWKLLLQNNQQGFLQISAPVSFCCCWSTPNRARRHIYVCRTPKEKHDAWNLN